MSAAPSIPQANALLAAPSQPNRPVRPLSPKAAFPTAKRLLSFIRAARISPTSITRHLANFYQMAEKETAGPWWKETYTLGTRDANHRKPVNYMGEMVRTYHPHLMGDALLPVVEPSGLGDRGSAKMLEYRLRQWSDDAAYAVEDERTILDALLAVGVMYVCRREGGVAIATEEGTLDLGQPCVQRVSIENMVIDPNAQTWEGASAIGHWIEVDRQSLLAAGIGNDTEEREAMLNNIPNVWESMEETKGLERKDGGPGDEDQYLDDKILLWEMCFSYGGRRFCCTLPPVNGTDMAVVDPYEIGHQEPEGSRYVVTALNSLPNSLMPISPAMVMMDAHLSKGAVVAKLVKQIEDLQRKYVVKSGAQDMVMRLKETGGDEYVIGDPDKIKEFIRGGMLKELVEAQAFLETLGQKVGPNMDLAGGKDDPSHSATVGSILAGQAAVILGYWKKKIDDGRTQVLRRVAAMLLQGGDQRTFMFNTNRGQQVPLVWDAATLDISYDQYKYKVRATSSNAGMDARAKLRSLFEIMSVLPGMIQLVAGMGSDPQKLLRVVADLAGMPELDEILPTGDLMGIHQQLMAMLAQGGQATPGGQGGGAKPVAGASLLPAPGPLPGGPSLLTPAAQLNSDRASAA